MKKKRFYNHAFSLMETMIWVGIIGIFVGIVGVAGMSFWDRAKVKAAITEMKIYSSALLSYYDSEGKYPTNDEGLKVLLDENYLTKTDFKDPWKNLYIYTVSDEGDGFMIKSLGSDKKDGGKGTKKDLVISENIEGVNLEDEL